MDIQLCVGQAITDKYPLVSKGCMYSQGLRCGEQFHGEPVPHEGLSAAQSETAGHNLQSMPVFS